MKTSHAFILGLVGFSQLILLYLIFPEWIYFYEEAPPEFFSLFPRPGAPLSLSTLEVWTFFSYIHFSLLICGAAIAGGLMIRSAKSGITKY